MGFFLFLIQSPYTCDSSESRERGETIIDRNPGKYSWDAEDYAKHSSSQFEWAQELVPKLKLARNECLLDIGCGDGKVTAVLAKCLSKGEVVGIDSSEEMISLACRFFSKNDFPNLSFLRMDARKLTFKDQFDVIFSNAALHWIIDQRTMLKRVGKCLRRPGRLLFQMGGKGNAQDVFSVLDYLLEEERWKPFFKDFKFPYGFYGPEDYEKWLLEVGLKPERVELLSKDMKLQGREGLTGWIRTTWQPYTQRLPIDLRDLFVMEIADRYLESHPLDEAGAVAILLAILILLVRRRGD